MPNTTTMAAVNFLYSHCSYIILEFASVEYQIEFTFTLIGIFINYLCTGCVHSLGRTQLMFFYMILQVEDTYVEVVPGVTHVYWVVGIYP